MSCSSIIYDLSGESGTRRPDLRHGTSRRPPLTYGTELYSDGTAGVKGFGLPILDESVPTSHLVPIALVALAPALAAPAHRGSPPALRDSAFRALSCVS